MKTLKKSQTEFSESSILFKISLIRTLVKFIHLMNLMSSFIKSTQIKKNTNHFILLLIIKISLLILKKNVRKLLI